MAAKTSGAEDRLPRWAGLPRWALGTRALLARWLPVTCNCNVDAPEFVFLEKRDRESCGTAVGYSISRYSRAILPGWMLSRAKIPSRIAKLNKTRKLERSEMGLPDWTKSNRVLEPRSARSIQSNPIQSLLTHLEQTNDLGPPREALSCSLC